MYKTKIKQMQNLIIR